MQSCSLIGLMVSTWGLVGWSHQADMSVVDRSLHLMALASSHHHISTDHWVPSLMTWYLDDTLCNLTLRGTETPCRYQLEKLAAAKAAWLVCLSLLSLTASFLVHLGPSGLIFSDLTGPYLALLGLTGPYWALLGLTGPYWALLGLIGPYWALLHLLNWLTD